MRYLLIAGRRGRYSALSGFEFIALSQGVRQVKMTCMECREIVRIGKYQTWRAARPKCMRCGSLRLEEYVSAPKRIRPDEEMGQNYTPSEN